MVLLTAISVLIALTVLFVLFAKRRNKYWERRGVPQFAPELILGNLGPVFTVFKESIPWEIHFLNIYKQAKERGFKSVGIYNFMKPEWMPIDLNIVKHIFLKDFQYFQGRGLFIHEKDPFSQHLFNTEGEEWKQLRAKLTPTFTTGKMKMMFETVLEKIDVLKKILDERASQEKEIRIKETMARFGTDVIGSVALGIECNSLEEEDNKFRKIGKLAFQPRAWGFILEDAIPYKILGNLGYRSFPKEVVSYFTDVVKATIRYRETNNVERKDFMQLMLQLKNQSDQGYSITEQEIITEAFLFYLAGFETSSSATTFALLELAQHQDIQDKLRQEIHEVLERNDGKISYDSLMEMKYLEQVFHEALRKYPPIPFIPRVTAERYKVPGSDVVIEKGTKVNIPAWGIQMDPEYYPNPEAFNPENFSPENKAKRPDYTWMPFGEGPRMCIGLRFGAMQSKMALAALIRDFRFTPHEKTKYPLEFEHATPVLTVRGDVWLKVHKL